MQVSVEGSEVPGKGMVRRLYGCGAAVAGGMLMWRVYCWWWGVARTV